LLKAIISLFNSKVNKNRAQFIFTSHNEGLMNLLRKDQIYFVDKNYYGESELYSLSDFKERNDISFSKNYTMGKYGAVPSIGNLENIIRNQNGK
jgi:AAA15 family ATPase/GTPase